MRKDETDGKHFLEGLLKYSADIGEKEAELRYWRESGEGGSDKAKDETILLRTGMLEAEIQGLKQKKLIATRMIDEIEDPVARAVFRRRYILGNTWAIVARSCGGMSQRNAHYIHDNAMTEFNKIYRNMIACS